MSNNIAQGNKTVQTVETASATILPQGNKTTQTVGTVAFSANGLAFYLACVQM
jgi:hypothetical protein